MSIKSLVGRGVPYRNKIIMANKMARMVLVVVIATAVMIVPPALFGCSDENGAETETPLTPADSPQMPARGFFKGVLPIPADGQGFGDAYEQAARYAEFTPVWASGIGASGFWEYPEKLRGGVHVEQLIRGNGMFPIIHFSFINKDSETELLILKTPTDMPDATLSDPGWRDAYRQAVLDAVEAARPLYLSVGNEVNRWYEQYGVEEGNANGFQHFVSLYEETYDAVKELSPETKVFCVFSREIVDELREADLDFLELFNPAKLDILVFTSYPHSIRKDAEGEMLADPHNLPSDIPDDYYSRILDYIPDKPFGFSEICWPSTEFYGGELGQKEFIPEATRRLTTDRGMELHLFGWPWLHDLGVGDDTGLIKRDGTEKLAYEAWKNL